MYDGVYFQWQNETLRKTIYPLRDMKLRDFLVYFKEIELWEAYQKKDLAKEKAAYTAKKQQAIARAAKA